MAYFQKNRQKNSLSCVHISFAVQSVAFSHLPLRLHCLCTKTHVMFSDSVKSGFLSIFSKFIRFVKQWPPSFVPHIFTVLWIWIWIRMADLHHFCRIGIGIQTMPIRIRPIRIVVNSKQKKKLIK
jgi:hypothetical protein